MDEECIRCGRLTAEGSDLCEGCIEKDMRYSRWKVDFEASHEDT